MLSGRTILARMVWKRLMGIEPLKDEFGSALRFWDFLHSCHHMRAACCLTRESHGPGMARKR